MSVNIAVRHVPEEVRDALAAQAARRGHSMQEYLLEELIRLANRPSLDAWAQEVRERKAAYGAKLTADEIVSRVREGRR